MFPIFYGDAKGPRTPKPGRPLLSIPGLDNEWYPDFEGTADLQSFGEMQGMFELPFPLGFPYMDFKVIDMEGLPTGDVIFQLDNPKEFFSLEAVFISMPNANAGTYPDTSPTNNESPRPTIQIQSSDPNRRTGINVTSGPQMFWKPIPVNHVGGPISNNSFGARLPHLRQFLFSPNDSIVVKVAKQNATDPAWLGIGIMGRSFSPEFIQGVIL